MPSSIEIAKPRPNKEFGHRWTLDDPQLQHAILRRLDVCSITPHSHPRVVDVASGDGPVALLLSQRGWPAGQITCVDQHFSKNPLVKGANWLYWDLRALASALRRNQPLPIQVSNYRSMFDVVTIIHADGLESWQQEKVAEFFKSPRGFIIG